MNSNQEYLNKVRIATPCSADWDKMEGDDRVRHCLQCNLDVFNISEMSSKDATRLIQESTGRICIQMYRRRDGTVITKDCPRGLERVRKAYRRTAAVIAGFIAWIGLAGPTIAQDNAQKTAVRGKVRAPVCSEAPEPLMGDIVTPEAGQALVPYKGEVEIVKDVDIKKPTPTKTIKVAKVKNPDRNHLLAAGLITMVFAALFKLIFMRMQRRSSIWLVGTAFISAFSLIGIIWHCFW